MTALRESLDRLACRLVTMTFKPDRYPSRNMTYEGNKEYILHFWSEAKAKLKRDVIFIAPIDALLDEMFTAFESGNRDKGVRIAMSLWAADIKKLR
ncbi:hypothetical protein [Ottowia cancrivicina]|uniref:Uncharacterized protein n=1 Tax=Ottowia cancrivicina TaxID=3040346 RepID=A0AAW6RF42_9BURK|nr:hypothetical protein [Ottowia sp. 10c7w1]MDG9698835.1 hypothetical protein [Ottowia sp. 10c7w1]